VNPLGVSMEVLLGNVDGMLTEGPFVMVYLLSCLHSMQNMCNPSKFWCCLKYSFLT
jgi:hypothetical protein